MTRTELDAIRARHAAAEALLRELRGDLVAAQLSQRVVSQIGKKLHDRLMAEERLRLIAKRIARIDAFLAREKQNA